MDHDLKLTQRTDLVEDILCVERDVTTYRVFINFNHLKNAKRSRLWSQHVPYKKIVADFNQDTQTLQKCHFG